MTTYIVRDTPHGYEIAIACTGEREGKEMILTEDGGHGPVEGLFAHAETTWHQLRAGQLPDVK